MPLLYGKQFLGQVVRSDWLMFGRDFTVRTITMETVRFVYSFSLPGNSKPHETQKVKTKALKSLLKAKYSFKRLLFLRFIFTDNMEDDKEYAHSPSEFYYPDELDLDETSIEVLKAEEAKAREKLTVL